MRRADCQKQLSIIGVKTLKLDFIYIYIPSVSFSSHEEFYKILRN